MLQSNINFNPRSPHGERPSLLVSGWQGVSHFNPRSPHGERLEVRDDCQPNLRFQSTLPARGATQSAENCSKSKRFQSTLPARGATAHIAPRSLSRRFQSTLPARGATQPFQTLPTHQRISIHAPRTGSDRTKLQADVISAPISIHAPRTGSDTEVGAKYNNYELISIHAPRTGSDTHADYLDSLPLPFQSTLPARGATLLDVMTVFPDAFQSTLPARGATRLTNCFPSSAKFQSTLPARGATICACKTLSASAHFNPRSPHGERRGDFHCPHCGCEHFNPRSPHGERRENDSRALRRCVISIHAPRTGSDPQNRRHAPRVRISIHAPRTGSDRKRPLAGTKKNDFNPRSPHGERQSRCLQSSHEALHFNPRSPHGERLEHGDIVQPQTDFNPRSPHGERLLGLIVGITAVSISIHAPRTGSDMTGLRLGHPSHNFNPRSPHGERPDTRLTIAQTGVFQSTLPARGATRYFDSKGHCTRFQSTLPARGATFPHGATCHSTHDFNPRSPHGERR